MSRSRKLRAPNKAESTSCLSEIEGQSLTNRSLSPFDDPASVRPSRPDHSLTEPSPEWWEYLTCGLIIAMLTGALIGPVFAPLQEETPVLRLVWLPAYAAIAVLAVARLHRVWRAGRAVGVWAAVKVCARFQPGEE